jgi:hypothetical protein
MSIKILDTFEPAGEFELVRAKDVKYQEENISVEEKLKALDDILNAEPEFEYSDTVTTLCPILKCPLIKLDLGETVNLEFKLNTAIQANCRINVDRRPFGSTGAFTRITEKTELGGLINISLGSSDVLSDYEYRITAIDNMGKWAKYKFENEDGTISSLAYLTFRVVYGGVQLKSTFNDTAKTNIFETNFAALEYPFTLNYSSNSYRWLFYCVTAENTELNMDVSGPEWKYLSLGYTEGGKPTPINKINLDFSTNMYEVSPFATPGNYKLHVCGGVSDTETFNYTTLLTSNIISDPIDILEPNSISITITKELPTTITNENYIDIGFIPKTNIPSIQGYKDITAVCTITRPGDPTFSPRSSVIESTHAEESIWYIGRLGSSEYSYTFTITCSAPGAEICESIIENVLIQESASDGRDFVGSSGDEAKNLLFYFDADTQYFNEDTGVWSSVVTDSAGDDSYSFHVKKLNKSLGIKNSTTLNSSIEVPTFKLAGDAYGILMHTNSKGTVPSNPWEVLSSHNSAGFTFEAYLRSKCIGTLAARAISARKDLIGNEIFNEQLQKSPQPGFSIGFDQIRADTAKSSTENVPLLEDSWQHLVISIDKDIRTKENNKIQLSDNDSDFSKKAIEDLNPYATMRIYINGVLVKATRISPKTSASDVVNDALVTSTTYPLTLNGSSKTTIADLLIGKSAVIENQGECEIRLMRGYKRGLTSSEVYKNYLNALIIEADRQTVLNRNGDDLIKVVFTKNRTWHDLDAQYWQNKKVKGKSLENSTFAVINEIKEKYSAGELKGSKDTFVNCTMHCYLNGTWIHEPNVDVYLQGTSTLEFPVKNYQIKVFEHDLSSNKRKKKAILPPFKTPENGWFIPDSVYTLKCDYMEQAHRNNTPTACYYQDHVLDAVVNSLNPDIERAKMKYSPPRQITEDITYTTAQNEVKTIPNVKPYRDAIDGFPCIVYFNDNGAIPGTNTFTGADANTLSGNNYVQTTDSYAGSYMFNIDKEGAQLGFEIGKLELPEGVTGIQVYDETDGEFELRYPKNAANVELTDIKTQCLPCISFEGATNDNYSAAAFVPWEYCQIEENRGKYNEGSRYYDQYNRELVEGYTTTPPSEDDTIPEVDAGEVKERLSFEDITKILDDNNGITVYYLSPDAESKTKMVSQAEFQASISKYDYFKATLEPRYNYVDNFIDYTDPETGENVYKIENFDDQVYNELTYSVLDRAIKWVYKNSTNLKEFKDHFSEYFSLEYCLTYYMQMMLFTQTDNAGKNAMFDTWGDGRLYPRPYDMDTQMGIDNSGIDSRLPSAELNIDLCPAYISKNQEIVGEFGVDHAQVPTWAATTSSNHIRFSFFNTRNSKLWKTFALAFASDIVTIYEELRTGGVYSVNAICEAVNAITADSIGESFYNKDAAIKYLSYKATVEDENKNITKVYDEKFLNRVQGNRRNRYRQFLEQRLIFLDSIYNMPGSPATSSIEIRSNTEKLADIGIRVYTPQYIRVSTDSGKQEQLFIFADPNDTYKLPGSNQVYNGTHLKIKLTGGDKNVLIFGAGNIQAINHTEGLNLTKFDLSSANKLTNIDVSNAQFLKNLTLTNNTYIRELNISSTPMLSSTMRLDGCANLEKIYAADSAISGLLLHPEANLKVLDLEGSGISSLSLLNYSQLVSENLNLAGCNALETLIIENCSALSDLPLNHLSSLTFFRLADCKCFNTVDLSGLKLLDTLELVGDIKELNLSGCSGDAFNNLNLTGLDKLEKLTLSGVSVDGTEQTLGKLFLPVTTLPTLKNLDMSSAKINTVSWNVTEDTPGLYDFTDVNFAAKAKVTFENNMFVKKVKNLAFTGSLDNVFTNCHNLEQLENCRMSSTSTSAYATFWGCSKLISIGTSDKLAEWNLSTITTASNIFRDCPKINYTAVSCFMKQMPNVENITNYMIHSYKDVSLLGDTEHPKTLYADFFINNKKLNSIYQAFYDTGFENISNFDKNGDEVKLKLGNTEVTAHLFTSCKNTLNDITLAFASMENLAYVPQDLLSECTGLTKAIGTFRSCGNLGTCGILNEVPCLLSTSFSVFNESNAITDISAMFAGCKNLNTPEKGSTTTLSHFMAPLDSVENAAAAFYNCKQLTHIPEGVLSTNTKLSNIDGMFAGTGIIELPNSLFTTSLVQELTKEGGYNVRHSNLVSARGLFANCWNLTGIINKYFFSGAPNIATLGNTSGTCIFLQNGVRLALPGAFANTKITGFHEEFLKPLESLTDVSMLFFNSIIAENDGTPTNGGGTISTHATSIAYKPNTASLESFTIYSTKGAANDKVLYSDYVTPNNTIFTGSSVITDKLFQNNKKLKTTQGMFAGNNKIVGIQQTLFSPFKQSGSVLTNISGMFMKCTELANGSIDTLLQNIVSLQNVSHMFADCSKLSNTDEQGNNLNIEYMFKGCTQLTNCKGFLMNTAISGNIPAGIFDDCRSSINDVSYMFAGCESLYGHIKTGYAIINKPDIMNQNYTNYLIDHYESLKDTLEYDSFEQFKEAVASKEYINENILDFNDYLEVYKVIDIQKKGLLSDCTALSTVDHMFCGCKNLSGAIPADMFYMSVTENNPTGINNKISSLEGLFENCHSLTLASPNMKTSSKPEYGTRAVAYISTSGELCQVIQRGCGNYSDIYPTIKVSENNVQIGNTEADIYLVPDNWLDSLTTLSNVSKLFYNVGTLRNSNNKVIVIPTDELPFTYSALKIPLGLFKSSKNYLSNLSGTFAFMSNTGKTVLNADFLSGCTQITNISDMFIGTKLLSIGTSTSTLFQKNGQTQINNVYRAFYGANTFEHSASYYTSADVLDTVFSNSLKTTGLPGSVAPVFNDANKFPLLSSMHQDFVGGAFTGTKVSPYYKLENGSYVANVTSTGGSIPDVLTAGLGLDIGANSGFSVSNLTWTELFGLNLICN